MIISSIFIETLTALKSFFILDPFGSLSVLFGFLSILSVHFGSLSISLVPFGSIWSLGVLVGVSWRNSKLKKKSLFETLHYNFKIATKFTRQAHSPVN